MSRQKRPALEVPEPKSLAEAWGGAVTMANLLEGRPVLISRAAGGVELWLELVLDLGDGAESRLAAKLEVVDPYLMAGEIAGAADAIVRQVAIDHGADAQATRELLRKQRLRERARRAEVAEQIAASGATHCDFCQRSVAFIVEGAKLCKRHAEELGVRPTGKVGEPEELPEAES